MKIEIGESLLLSWLRHSKNCQLVQTNWKPSVSSWELKNEDEIKQLMDVSGEFFRDKYGFEVYKNNSFMQLLQQAEIDVIGMSFSQANIQDIYAIDVAFHESGLNYGGKIEIASRVVKKFIRTAMCLYGYFDINRGEIIFATPKVNNSVLEIINPSIDDIINIFNDLGFNYKVRFIANDDFAEKIVEPVIASSSLVADTSELFMRSIQMYNLCSRDIREVNGKSRLKSRETRVKPIEITSHNGLDEMKIGVLVRSTLTNLIETEKISREEIQKMLTASYSKEIFNMNYPILKEVNEAVSIEEQKKDVNGYNRYWSNTVEVYGKKYLICSQWVEHLHRDKFNKWLTAKIS